MAGPVKVVEVSQREQVVVLAQGMVSALGLSAVSACAAARAGVRRAQCLDQLSVASLDGRVIEPAVGHQVPLITHGFEGVPRLVQLTAGALRDLTGRFLISADARPGFYISMPSGQRHRAGADLIREPSAKEAFLATVADEPVSTEDRTWANKILSLAMDQVNPAAEIPLCFVTYAGHTGFAEALGAAISDLRSEHVGLALVGGIDSLVDERTLKWLALTGRLKCGSNPAGLEPGEAAVFLAIALRPAGAREVAALSRIERVATSLDDSSTLLGQQPTGRALARCIGAMGRSHASLWLISDHNGEVGRAMEFGNLVAQISNQHFNWAPYLFPAGAFGDTGAASAGIGACLAQNSFIRNYAPAPTGIVASMGDGPQRSAFSISYFEKN